MFPFMRFAEGLFLAHAWLGLSFLIGTTTIPWLPESAGVRGAALMTRVVCSCAIGYAALTISWFFLAQFGLLKPAFVSADVALLFATGTIVWRQSPWKISFWAERLRALSDCWTAPLMIVYYAMLILALPAVTPNIGGDPVHYYLAYAQDWAAAGSLVVDPFLRFPFWASNVTLTYAILILFHAQPLFNFVPWSMGLLSALGICAVISDALWGKARRAYVDALAVFLAFSVILQPTFLRWLDTAYTDVTAGTFAQLAVTCLFVAKVSRRTEWLFGAAICAAFMIGTKPSYVSLLPVFIIALFAAGRSIKLPAAKAAWAAAALILLASPWYVRNLALAGDPIAPVLNIALDGRDGLILPAEWERIQQDLYTEKSPQTVATLPFRAFLSPPSFREFGTSALILALYAPAVFVLVIFSLRKRVGFALGVAAFVLLSMVAYWSLTSALLRYSLLFYPLLAICVGLCMARIVQRYPRSAFAFMILAGLAIWASPGARAFYVDRAEVSYHHISQIYTSDAAYLNLFANGYIEERATAKALSRSSRHGVIYALGGDVDYFFRRDHFISAGDWIGPGGYFRLYEAVDAGQAAQFLRGLGADALLVDRKFGIAGLNEPLERQLLRNGFCKIPLPSKRFDLLAVCPR